MSTSDDLHDFVTILGQRLAALGRGDASAEGQDAQAWLQALEELGVLDLAEESNELDDPLTWLSAAVRTVARRSPSVAFALATRFAGQRVAPDQPAAVAGVAVDQGGSWRATVPTLLGAGTVVLLRRVEPQGRVVAWEALTEEPAYERTGLRDARLRSVLDPTAGATGDPLSEEAARKALFELDILNASVGMGLLEQALATAEEYAASRRQFGQPVATFPGLAAILVEMRLRVSSVSGLLAASLAGHRDPDLAAVVGRACVNTCLDAIQVHGGYGYIDEYPVAGMLRDAVSLRARGGGRRSATAAVAASHLPFISAKPTPSEVA